MRVRRRSHSRPDGKGSAPGLFVALLVLLVWLPIPFGSDLHWSAALMEVWVYLLAAVWLFKYARGRVTFSEPFRQARAALILLGLWLGFGILQIIPLPASVVAAISPNTAALHQQAQLGPRLEQQELRAESGRTAVAVLPGQLRSRLIARPRARRFKRQTPARRMASPTRPSPPALIARPRVQQTNKQTSAWRIFCPTSTAPRLLTPAPCWLTEARSQRTPCLPSRQPYPAPDSASICLPPSLPGWNRWRMCCCSC